MFEEIQLALANQELESRTSYFGASAFNVQARQTLLGHEDSRHVSITSASTFQLLTLRTN